MLQKRGFLGNAVPTWPHHCKLNSFHFFTSVVYQNGLSLCSYISIMMYCYVLSFCVESIKLECEVCHCGNLQ